MASSLGGWDEIKKMRFIRQERIKNHLRVLGESDLVMDAPYESEHKYSRKHRLKCRYDNLEKIAGKVSSLSGLEKDYITARGRQRDRARAMDLLSYWCAVELGFPVADLAKRLDMTTAFSARTAGAPGMLA